MDLSQILGSFAGLGPWGVLVGAAFVLLLQRLGVAPAPQPKPPQAAADPATLAGGLKQLLPFLATAVLPYVVEFLRKELRKAPAVPPLPPVPPTHAG